MSQRDIAEQIKNLYDVEISPELVSKISEKILPEVTVWQNRPLETIYPFVFMEDAIHYKVKENHQYITKAAYADVPIDSLFFIGEAVYDMIMGKNAIENMSPSEFLDYWFSNESDSFRWGTLISNPIGFTCMIPSIYGMEQSEYMAVKTSKDMLNKLKDSANSFLKNYYKDLRINTFEDFHLQTYDKVEC